MRVTQTTPDPVWLVKLDVSLRGYIEIMLRSPVIRAAQSGRLDRVRMRRFMIQVGKGIIEPFYAWLVLMRDRIPEGSRTAEGAGPYDLLWKFLDENVREELLHDRQWWAMSRAWGVRSRDIEKMTVDPEVMEITDHLTRLAKSGDLQLAVLAVNFVVESVAAMLTTAVAQGLLPVLTSRQGRWVRIHKGQNGKDGDEDHRRDARELLKLLVHPDSDFAVLEALLDKTAYLFGKALIVGYSELREPIADAPARAHPSAEDLAHVMAMAG